MIRNLVAVMTCVVLAGPRHAPAAPGDEASVGASRGDKVKVVVVDGAPAAAGEADVRPGRDGGEPAERIAVLDDELPLPRAARVVADDEKGDKVTRPRSGDPYFLGFAAGEYRPPSEERLDPSVGDAIAALGSDARKASEVYAFVMMAKRITPGRVASLEALGLRHLGYHPYACLKAAIPVSALPDVASHPDVRWVGLARPWQKVHPHLVNVFQERGFDQRVNVYVNLFESDLNDASIATPFEGRSFEVDPGAGSRPGTDASTAQRWQSNGWQQRALEDAGVRVREFVPDLNAFRAQLTYAELDRITRLDFVQFVEAELVIRPTHGESTPMILADRVRAFYDGGTNSAALVGEIDSGVRITHEALDHIYYVGWDVTGSSGGVFDDNCDHGTHVFGTMLGKPPASKAGMTGVAPGLGWGASGRARIVKYLEFVGAPINDCSALLPLNLPLSYMSGNYVDTSGVLSPKPHVVNNSWGTDPGTLPWIGSEYLARTLDQEVANTDITYVFSSGNAGPGAGSIGLPGGAKNVLAVGNVTDFQTTAGDPGVLSNSSSVGPCADNRWKPNVVAPGSSILSAVGTGNASYGSKTGTSMAAPHVTGVVAQAVDRHSFLRYRPARIASLLMATATTANNQLLTSPSNGHLDQLGAGRVDAYRAVYNTSQMEWTNWGFDQAPGTWRYGEFDVGAGATRLVVCMHYTEPAISAGANLALLNDFDLYIDQVPADITVGNSGEFTAQQSGVDNTEIRSINNPAAGTWAWKVFPNFTLTSVRVGVTVHVIYGDTTPDGSLTLSADDMFVKPGEDVTITATASNPEFVASAVFLDAAATAGVNLISSSTELDDGVVTDLTGNPAGGFDVLLGNIRHGDSRTATWVVDWGTSGTKVFQVNARSDNWVDKNGSLQIVVDGGLPGTVSSLTSTTHTPNVWSSSTNATYTWGAANDSLSGIEGYSVFTSLGGASIPNSSPDIGAVTSFSESLATSSSGYYFNIRAVDKAGNVGNALSVGPYLVDAVAPGLVNDLLCFTHTPGVWSNQTQVGIKWNPAVDQHSGIDGYGVFTSSGAAGLPGATKDIEEVTSYTETLASSASGRYFNIRSVDNAGNWDSDYASVGPLLIDTVDPGTVTTLTSSTHTAGVWTNETSASYQWTAATDSHSGVKGYGISTDTFSAVAPGAVQDIGAATSHSETLSHNSAGQYFKVRSVDNAGNWDDQFASFGPLLIDTVAPTQPTNITSSHGSTWKNSAIVTMNWNASTDGDSGLAGYDTIFTTLPSSVPNGPLDQGPTSTAMSATLPTGQWYFHIRPDDVAGNSGSSGHFGPLRVDLTAPAPASNLKSFSHAVNVPTIDAQITMTWFGGSDAHSGLAGYIGLWNQSPTTVPTGVVNIAASATSHTAAVSGNGGGWYFHLRTADNAGNLGPTVHAGPYVILPCVQASNASYGVGKKGTNGIPVLNPLQPPVLGEVSTVRLENALPGALPILFLGVTQTNIPFDGGTLLTEGTWILALPVPILPDGTLPLTGALPSDPGLCGFKLFHQVMFADPGAAGYYHLAQTAGLVRIFGY